MIPHFQLSYNSITIPLYLFFNNFFFVAPINQIRIVISVLIYVLHVPLINTVPSTAPSQSIKTPMLFSKTMFVCSRFFPPFQKVSAPFAINDLLGLIPATRQDKAPSRPSKLSCCFPGQHSRVPDFLSVLPLSPVLHDHLLPAWYLNSTPNICDNEVNSRQVKSFIASIIN